MKKVLAISSVLIGVVFLAGCGQQPVSQTQSTTPTPVAQTPTQQPTTPPANETAGWQTYTSTNFGFEFKHPQSISFISEKEEKFGENMNISLMVNGGKEWQNRPFSLLAVKIWTKDEYGKLLKNPDSYSSTQLKAGMSKAIEKDNKVYELTFGFQDGPTQLTNFVQTEDYKKLLSTFKIIK